MSLTPSPSRPVSHPRPAVLSLNTPASPNRLLVPAAHLSTTPQTLPRSPRIKVSANKLSRASRAGSVDIQPLADPGANWPSKFGRFEAVPGIIELSGYQLFAVEKWVVERKSVTAVAVHTGDHDQKISVVALVPPPVLPYSQAADELSRAVHELRKDGARPRELPEGTLMVTSLATFRSDLNIVPVPGGNLLEIQEKLYVNINLLRMGCSGRSALTLDDPNPSSKDKFLQTYDIPEPTHFSLQFAILEVVKMVQSALSIFGMFDIAQEDRNGLLDDYTLAGVQRWVSEIGPYLELEPMERILDPAIIAALFSLVTSMRNKLIAIGLPQVPRDPFSEPALFTQSLVSFQLALKRTPPISHADYELIQVLNETYDRIRLAEPNTVRRVIRDTLGDLTSASSSLATGITSLPSRFRSSSVDATPGSPLSPSSSQQHHQHHEVETSSLEAFVRNVLMSSGKDRDAPETLKWLWTTKATALRRGDEAPKDIKSKSKASGLASSIRLGKEKDPTLERERENSKAERRMGDEDDGDIFGTVVSRGTGKTQKKSHTLVDGIAGWAGGRLKKGNEVNNDSDLALASTVGGSRHVSAGSYLEEESANPESIRTHPEALSISTSNLSKFQRLVSKHYSALTAGPIAAEIWQNKAASFSDPILPNQDDISLHTEPGTRDQRSKKFIGPRRDLGEDFERKKAGWFSPDYFGVRDSSPSASEVSRHRSLRRKSFSDLLSLKDMIAVPVDRLKTDVRLCGQYFEMRDYDQDIQSSIALMQALLISLQSSNAQLSDAVESRRKALSTIETETSQLMSQTRQGRADSEEVNKRAKTLGYQVERLQEGTDDLKATLDGYTKRTNDARNLATGAGYVLEKFEEEDMSDNNQ